MIADAHCEKRGKSDNARLTIKQSGVHKDWFFWLYEVYSSNNLCSSKPPTLKTTSLKYNPKAKTADLKMPLNSADALTSLHAMSGGVEKSYSYYKFNTYAR